MAHSWAAFARTGNPSTEQIEWPAFEPESGKVLVIDEEPKVQTDPLKKIREGSVRKKLRKEASDGKAVRYKRIFLVCVPA